MIAEQKAQASTKWRWTPSQQWSALVKQREEQVFLLVTLLIGALVGMAVVAFIVLTERFGARIDATVAPAWRRLLVPIVGSLSMGFLLYKYFPDARGSGVVCVGRGCRRLARPGAGIRGAGFRNFVGHVETAARQ